MISSSRSRSSNNVVVVEFVVVVVVVVMIVVEEVVVVVEVLTKVFVNETNLLLHHSYSLKTIFNHDLIPESREED